jgi:hypothetical protein
MARVEAYMTGFDGFEDLLYDDSCAAPSHPRMQMVTELESRSTKRFYKGMEWSDRIASAAASNLSFPGQLENNTTGPLTHASAQSTRWSATACTIKVSSIPARARLAMAICVENLVGFKQSSDARAGRPRKEFQERG